MTPHESEADARVYDGLGRAIRSVNAPNIIDAREDIDLRRAAGIIVYRNNVRAAFLRVLRDAFPVVHRLVGEEFFRYLAHEYFHAHPPSSPLVSQYGDKLPDFLESFEPAAGLPYLPDTARLERAWLGAYHAAEAECLAPKEVIALLDDDPESAVVELHPSVRLIRSPFAVHTIWLHNRTENKEKLRLPDAGECVVVKRPAHQVFTQTVTNPVWTLLAAFRQGKAFGEALAEAIKDDKSASAAELIRVIATSNVIAAVRKPLSS